MKKKSTFLFMALDFFMLIFAVLLALSLQWKMVDLTFLKEFTGFGYLAVACLVTSFYILGVYHRLWEYAGINDFLNIALAVTAGTLILFLLTLVLIPAFPMYAILFLWVISLVFFGGIRFIMRLLWIRSNLSRENIKSKNTLIVGAGGAGSLIVRTLQFSKAKVGLKPIGFVDDDIQKHGLRLYGLPILGTRKDIPEIIRNFGVEEIILAIPSATPEHIKAIARICQGAGIVMKVLPSVLAAVQGENLLNQVQELQMEDLLHRTEVEINLGQISSYLEGKVVLVTGAGGSIGSELCRQICGFQPKELILLGRGENSIHEIILELAQNYPQANYIPVIADIRDQDKLFETFSKYKPDVVFHAAAHKHVNLMELHPDEAFKNNVFGTRNVARLADYFKAEVFVLISTDKAVNPCSIMGLSKLLAEMVVRKFAETSETKFVAVRFGNVLGSRGSVVHLFRRQIAAGGPITITHPDMRRFFMTIKEAVQLVIQAGALAKGGELFMLDMGEQVKIVDLARDMIRLSGLTPGKDIQIKFVGIRPGEKIYEELLTEKEKALATQHQKIFVVEAGAIDYDLVEQIFSVNNFPTHEQISILMESAFSKYKWSGLR